MNRIHLGHAIMFVCLLAIIVIVACFARSQRDKHQANQQQQQAQQLAEQQRAAAAVNAEKEKYFGYVNTNIVRNPGEEMVAVACASENGTMNSAIGDALATHFKRDHVKFVSSFFRPTMITDGSFDAVFVGSKETLKKMGLEKTLDGLLLAKQDVQYSKNDALDGVITADMHVQIVTLPVTGQIESQSWTLSAKGTGFNNADARMQAEERIIKQITVNTNMALSQFNTNH